MDEIVTAEDVISLLEETIYELRANKYMRVSLTVNIVLEGRNVSLDIQEVRQAGKQIMLSLLRAD